MSTLKQSVLALASILGVGLTLSIESYAQSTGFVLTSIGQPSTDTRYPSLSKRILPPRLTTRIYSAPEHGAIELNNGGTYLISGGNVIGGFYYRSNATTSSSLSTSEQVNALQRPARLWLSGKQLRASETLTQLDVMDLTGRKLFSARGGRDVPLSLSSGTYLLRAIFPSQTFVCRLTVR